MNVEPVGLPAAMKAWRDRDPEPVLVVRCGADADCAAEVGAVYHTPQGYVVESRLTPPGSSGGTAIVPASPAELEAFADEIGLVGLLDDVDGSSPVGAGGHAAGGAGDRDTQPDPAEAAQTVRAQLDMLGQSRFWQDPRPLCPEHGELSLDRTALNRAVRADEPVFHAAPA